MTFESTTRDPRQARHPGTSDRGAHSAPRLIVKSPGHLTFVDFDEIDWLSAAGNYVRVYAGATVHIARETMNGMGARLDARFARVHRSAIVNTHRIRRISTDRSARTWVVLKDGTEVPAGREIEEHLAGWMRDAC